MAQQAKEPSEGQKPKESMVRLTTRAGQEFVIDIKTARVSRTIDGMLDVTVEEDGDTLMSTPILIDCPHTDVLGKVLDWAKHHKNDPPCDLPRCEDEYSVWDLMFFNVSDNTLLKILVIANFLEMRDLFRQTITMLRHRLKSQTEEQLRRRSGAYGDPAQLLSPTEIAQIKRENALVKTGK